MTERIEGEPILVATIPGPLPLVPENVIRTREPEEAIEYPLTALSDKERLAAIGIKPENSSITYHDALRAYQLGREAAAAMFGEMEAMQE